MPVKCNRFREKNLKKSFRENPRPDKDYFCLPSTVTDPLSARIYGVFQHHVFTKDKDNRQIVGDFL